MYKTVDLRWRAFCLRKTVERFHHLFTCVNKLRKKRVCGKIYPACETNDDTYTAKNRLMLRRVAASYCPHLSLIAKKGVAIIEYATISALEIHHRRENILPDIYIFHPFRILAFLYFRASAAR